MNYGSNESREYRDARDLWLKDEQELIDKVTSVVARRCTLPPGGQLKEDYLFQWANDGRVGQRVKFSELFGYKNTLLRYSFMYGPGWDKPCPSCTSLVDGFESNLISGHSRRRVCRHCQSLGRMTRLQDVGIQNVRASAAAARRSPTIEAEHPGVPARDCRQGIHRAAPSGRDQRRDDGAALAGESFQKPLNAPHVPGVAAVVRQETRRFRVSNLRTPIGPHGLSPTSNCRVPIPVVPPM